MGADKTMINLKMLSVTKQRKVVCTVAKLAVAAGERVAIQGSNGSGKTTLLRVLAGLERSFAGECAVAVPLKRRVYVHQTPFLFRGSVLSNVMYGLRARGIAHSQAAAEAIQWLEQFELAGVAREAVTHLSGGERRRVALARAMAIRPAILLLDEPLADMDTAGAQALARGLAELPETAVCIATPSALPECLEARTYRLTKVAESSSS